MNASDGSGETQKTSGSGDSTDAAFSSDSQRIIFSGDADLKYANLYVIPVSGGSSKRLTFHNSGYDGAPSWSPDGAKVAFESSAGDPDAAGGTTIWIIDVPDGF